jgi:hypothetical protein
LPHCQTDFERFDFLEFFSFHGFSAACYLFIIFMLKMLGPSFQRLSPKKIGLDQEKSKSWLPF